MGYFWIIIYIPFGNPFNFKPSCRLWFATNTLPHGEPTHGFERRLLLAEFNVVIPQKDQNSNLEKEICETELPGIFNIVLDHLKDLIKQGGFTQSESMQKALKKYMQESDNVKMFIEDENWEPSSDNKILLKDFNSLYRTYCSDSGYSPCSVHKFGNRLRSLGFKVERSTGNYFYVYCIKKVFEKTEELVSRDDKEDWSPLEKACGRRFPLKSTE